MTESLAVATPAQALALLSLPQEELFARATALREAAFGRNIVLCAIINAKSGNCSMDCRFCSQSRHNHTPIEVFSLLPDEELRERILQLAALPVARIGVVTSGSALSGSELQRLCKVIAALPDDVRPRVCASLGKLAARDFADLSQSGLTRFHHNLETARDYYASVCTTQTWDQRRETVLRACDSGMSVCSGGLFGLGESWEDRVNFAFSLKELGVGHVPMNFLHPHPETPLAGQQPLSANDALTLIAIFRHILPTATLRICGGRPLVLGDRQGEIFAAGANALMTGDYLTTHGQSIAHDLEMIAALGLEVRCDARC